ncbi:hypothetical protein EDD17DRAFT_1762217 [Pisolithus thermaeus]|nr:hypothetical protein EDD17DRAFT_1762217 [Pisolithus thermaeus]
MSLLPTGIPFTPLLPSNTPLSNPISQTLPAVSSLIPPPMSNIIPPLPFSLMPIIHPVTPNNTSMNPGNASQQILAAYTLLSPASKASLDILINRECITSSLSHWANVPCALPFDLDEDTLVVTPDATTLPVSNLIDNLADSGFHIPLSLFLYSSLYKVQNQPLAVKTIKVHHKGQNVYILDISQFPPKTEMAPVNWHATWEHLLEWIGSHEGHIKKHMWAYHFHFLTCKDNFIKNFPAILCFDIKICSSCAANLNFSMLTNQPLVLNISLLMNANLAAKVLRIPFKEINTPLPPASSVYELVTNFPHALKRLCRKVNKHLQNAKTESSSIETMAT